jgi:hypothetical protein
MFLPVPGSCLAGGNISPKSPREGQGIRRLSTLSAKVDGVDTSVLEAFGLQSAERTDRLKEQGSRHKA